MDRSNSIASSRPSSSAGPFHLDRSNSISSGRPSGPFAYQTRLLEGTSSRSGTGGLFSRTKSLSRTNSLSGPSSSGTSGAPANTRRWTPSHRVGSSVDNVRGKWEERARAEAILDDHRSPSPSKEMPVSGHASISVDQPYTDPLTPLTSASAMSPTPYRSSYMSNKNKTYGDSLSAGRKLGNHLPRIASGDADDDWVKASKEDMDKRRRRETREKERRGRVLDEPVVEPATQAKSLRNQDIVITGVSDLDDVAGIPGRLRLSRDKTPSAPASPLPSAPLARGLWADTQRQHLQAYEYLCHVGEAQQWIEGCLGEELEFGVVEMEEGLRNGVVLAKLVRAFRGEKIVRKIYEVCMKYHLLNL